MMTSAIYGLPITPAAVADEKGNTLVVQAAASAAWLERLLRPAVEAMGCSAGFSARPLTGGEAQAGGAACLMQGAQGTQAHQPRAQLYLVLLPPRCRPAAQAGGGA